MEYREICLLVQDIMKNIINDNMVRSEYKQIILDIFNTVELSKSKETDTYMVFISSLIHLVDLLNDKEDEYFNKKIFIAKMKIIEYIYNREGFMLKRKNEEPIFSQIFTGAFNIK